MNGDGHALKPGVLLVSEPFTQDVYFQRSVVIITEHNDWGSVGFVLNKPLRYKLSDLVQGFPTLDYKLSLGGPVSHTTLNFLHIIGDVLLTNALYVKDGVYWGGDFDVLTSLAKSGMVCPEEIIFFLGYSGWAPGQLENEIAAGGWAVVPSAAYDLMHAEDSLWYEIVYKEPALSVWKFIPEHPEDN